MTCPQTDPDVHDWNVHLSAAIAAQPTFRKRNRNNGLNLSSNELHHADLASLFEEFITTRVRGIDPSQYPAFDDVTGRVCQALELPPGWCAVVPGSDSAIRAFIEAFSSTGRLLAPLPCYRAYRDYAAAFGVAFHGVISVTKDYEVEQLTAAIESASPSLVTLTNPDGFTGRCLPLSIVDDLASAAARSGSLLVVDEAYSAFAPIDHRPLLARYPNTILLRSLSKSHGAAGIRLALVLARPDLLIHLLKTRIVNGVSSVALEYLNFTLDRTSAFRQIQADIADWRNAYEVRLRAAHPGWRVPPSRGNFIAFDVRCATTAAALERTLAARNVFVRSLADEPGLSTTLRATVAPPVTMGPALEVLDRKAL